METAASLHSSILLVNAVANLGLALLVGLYGRATALGAPLILFCLTVAGWNGARFGESMTGDPRWHLIYFVLNPLSVPLALHVCLTFLGIWRRYRAQMLAFYLLVEPLLFLSRHFLGTGLYAFLSFLLPTTVIVVVLLLRHLRRTVDEQERARTMLFMWGFAVAALLAPTEYLEGDWSQYRVGVFSPLILSGLVVLGSVRFRLLGAEIPISSVAFALLASLLASLGALGVLLAAGAGLGPAIFGAMLAIVCAMWAARWVLARNAAALKNQEELAVLGAFSRQMAHDLQNPLAALKGGLQYLEGERAKGKPLADYDRFVDLMLEQAERLGRIISDYRRVGRIEPVFAPVDINGLVEQAVALMRRVDSHPDIEVRIFDNVGELDIDEDMMRSVLENVVENARQAKAKHIVLSSEKKSADWVEVRIEDDGAGMDARQIERAFDDFFTTKSGGSGLGLSFVSRVLRAHGGGQGSKVSWASAQKSFFNCRSLQRTQTKFPLD